MIVKEIYRRNFTLLVFLVIILSVINCSFQVGIPSVTPQHTPSADSTYKMDITNKFIDLVHFGIINHKTDFSGIPLQYTVVDSDEAPIPYARIVTVVDSAKILFRTDDQGKAYIAFDSLAIIRHPKIYGIKNNKLYSVTMDFGFSGEAGGNVEVADITMLQPYPIGADLILYNTLPKDSLHYISSIITDQRDFISNNLQLTPIHWATAIMQVGKTYTTPQTSYQFNHTNYTVFAYSKENIYKNLVFINIHEWVEQTLLHRINFTGAKYRWLTDGIAEWAPWAFYSQLPDSTREKIGLPVHKISTGIEKLIKYLNQSKQRSFELKNWKVIHTEGNQTLPTLQITKEAVQYKVAASFWLIVTQYDASILPKFLSRISQMKSVSDEEIINQLNDLLPSNLQSLLESFPVTRSIREWQKYKANFLQ